MRLIKPVYEILPFLCIGGGYYAMAEIGGFMAVTSGFLLAATGILIIVLRIDRRFWK